MSARVDVAALAHALCTARCTATPLADFPGDLPGDLEMAYAVQSAVIAGWPDRIVGWKVGWIAPARRDGGGDERLVGPMFAAGLQKAPSPDVVLDVPVYRGGFAAVEAEFVAVIGEDAPADRIDWSPADAAAMIDQLCIGVEVASSPLAQINALGPAAVVCDVGNHAGLLLGPAIADWRTRALEEFPCGCRIEGEDVGRGGAWTLPGGPLAATAFALSRCARLGRPLRRGDLVSTGAASGIHEIAIGAQALLDFGGDGAIACRAVAMVPR